MEFLSDAMQAVSDAVASGDPIVAAVAGAMVIALVVLKFLGKNIPVLDPILRVVLGVVKKLRAPKELPAKDEGVADIVPIKSADDKPKEP